MRTFVPDNPKSAFVASTWQAWRGTAFERCHERIQEHYRRKYMNSDWKMSNKCSEKHFGNSHVKIVARQIRRIIKDYNPILLGMWSFQDPIDCIDCHSHHILRSSTVGHVSLNRNLFTNTVLPRLSIISSGATMAWIVNTRFNSSSWDAFKLSKANSFWDLHCSRPWHWPAARWTSISISKTWPDCNRVYLQSLLSQVLL